MMSDETILSLPVTQIQNYKLRAPVDMGDFDEVLSVLSSRGHRVSTLWSRRFKRNQALLSSGEIVEVATVVRDLTTWSRRNILSAAERTMRERAYTNLLAELNHAAAGLDLDVASLVEAALQAQEKDA